MAASHPQETAPDAPSAARAFAIAGGLIVAVAVLDQASKWLIVDYFLIQPSIVRIAGFFNLALTYNTGISFGIFRDGDDWVRWVLVIVQLGIVAVLLEWLRREPGKILSLAIGLVCGGAIGNVVDRIRIGAVVDFLDFHLGSWHWPAFNLADSAIAIGVAGLILDGLFRPSSSSKE